MTTTTPPSPSAHGLRPETRRNLLRLLAWARRAMTPDEIAAALGASACLVEEDLQGLQARGMVRRTSAGYWLGPAAAVSLGGFVGQVLVDWG